MKTKSGIIGFILILIGGMGLDSEGKAYYVMLSFCALGLILLLVEIRTIYKIEQNKEKRAIQRAIDRERRKQA